MGSLSFSYLLTSLIDLIDCLAILVAVVLLVVMMSRQLLSLLSRQTLVFCPDCSHRVSRRALLCPHCGRPLDASGRNKRGHSTLSDKMGDIGKHDSQ
jgi:hypothetical protein